MIRYDPCNKCSIPYLPIQIPFGNQLLISTENGITGDIELDWQSTCGRQPCTGLQISAQDVALQMGIKLLIEWNVEFGADWVLWKNDHPSSLQIMLTL